MFDTLRAMGDRSGNARREINERVLHSGWRFYRGRRDGPNRPMQQQHAENSAATARFVSSTAATEETAATGGHCAIPMRVRASSASPGRHRQCRRCCKTFDQSLGVYPLEFLCAPQYKLLPSPLREKSGYWLCGIRGFVVRTKSFL